MEAQAVERKYALIRIESGDYLLPDNDGKRIWRIARYEDGKSHGLIDWDHDEMFWGWWRWADGIYTPQTADDPTDWGYWDMVGGFCGTRRDAIQNALTEPRADDWEPRPTES